MTITAVAPPAGWTQTNRTDVHDLLLSMAAAFQAANPTVIRAYWHDMPEDLSAEGPFVYIGEIKATVQHSEGLRVTIFTGTLGYVDVLTERFETDDRVNAFLDFMRDWFTVNMRTLPRGLFEEIDEGDVPPLHEGQYPFAHVAITWRYQVQEGRTP